MILIKYFSYVLLGILQGITEPLPISSSGHLFLARLLFNTNLFNDLTFPIVANFGSLLAILYLFRKDLIKLIKEIISSLKKKDYQSNSIRYLLYLVIGTLPACLLGLFLHTWVESLLSLSEITCTFFFTGLFLLSSRASNKEEELTWKKALLIGLAQAIALIPGISRSGMVLVTCLLCGLSKKDALTYTFLLYIPVSLGALLLSIPDLGVLTDTLLFPYLGGCISAFIATLLTYQWLSSFIQKGKLWKFSYYLFIMGILLILYQL